MAEPFDQAAAAANGAELARLIRREAGQRGLTVTEFLSPLTRWPTRWLAQLSTAGCPRSLTRERIRALLSGETVPPSPPNNFWKNGPQRPPMFSAGRGPAAPPRIAPRDPCQRCGTRADIGCRHIRASSAAEAAHG